MKVSVTLLFMVYQLREVLGQGNGYLRLVSSDAPGHGRLEMGYDSVWTPFSIDGFDMHEADIACKRLGHAYASRYGTVESFGYAEATTNYSISALRCSDSDYVLTFCKFSTTYSYDSHSSDVGLQCANRTNDTTPLRLVPRSGNVSSSVLSGRLEILINDTWGTVCDDRFRSAQAAVACNQLGFISYKSFDNAKNLDWDLSDLENTPIWLDDLRYCHFSRYSISRDLRFCSITVGVHDCIHDEDIILTCNPGAATEPPTPDLRPLVGSLRLVYNNRTFEHSNSEGRLELYFNHSSTGPAWTPICYNSFIDSNAADLVCRKLRYYRALEFGNVEDLMQVQSSSQNHLYLSCYRVNYFGGCKYYIGSCSHQSEVAVSCTNMPLPGLPVGAKVGIAVTVLVVCSVVAIGTMVCIILAGVMHHKKKISKTCAAQYCSQDTSDFKSIHMVGVAECEEDPKAGALDSSSPHHPKMPLQSHTESGNDNRA